MPKKSGFKMKGSPMQRNFGISPMKQDERFVNKKGDEFMPDKNVDKIEGKYLKMKGGGDQYINLEESFKADPKRKTQYLKETGDARKYNKAKQNYLNYAKSISPDKKQRKKSKGTLTDPSNPDVRHDDYFAETIIGPVNVSKQLNKARRKANTPSLYDKAKRFVRGGWRE